ncbi:unnamed protein product [Ectocarpus sp. 12 AP-2014]
MSTQRRVNSVESVFGSGGHHSVFNVRGLHVSRNSRKFVSSRRHLLGAFGHLYVPTVSFTKHVVPGVRLRSDCKSVQLFRCCDRGVFGKVYKKHAAIRNQQKLLAYGVASAQPPFWHGDCTMSL